MRKSGLGAVDDAIVEEPLLGAGLMSVCVRKPDSVVLCCLGWKRRGHYVLESEAFDADDF